LKRLAIMLSFVLSMGLAATAMANSNNGAPQGAPDYQLNILGSPGKMSDQTVDDWGGNGARIFVPLNGSTKIYLEQGDYAVLDANGTDGKAYFQLPAPGLDAYLVGDPGTKDVVSDYSVFVRPLGKPGGWSTITTCADLLDSSFGGLVSGSVLNLIEGSTYCSIEEVGADITTRDVNPSHWSNVTAELTTLVLEVVTDTGTVYVRVPIFDDSLENEYWQYDNHGLRLLQVRFYDCSTNVETGDSTC
jgi:hypothetical protein